MSMPIRIRRFVLGAAFAMTLFGVTTQVSAQERCSVATLRGNYGFRVDGTAFGSPFAAVADIDVAHDGWPRERPKADPYGGVEG